MPENQIGETVRSRQVDRITVAVLVENELLRHGLDAVLRQVSRVTVVRQFGSEAEAQLILRNAADVVIVTPAEQHWLAPLSEECQELRPKVLVLMSDTHLRALDVFGSSTIDGVLLLDELSAKLLDDALYQLMLGQTPLPNRVAHQLIARAAGSTPAATMRPAVLTPRESETLALLADGMSNKQIARALGVSSHGAKRLVGGVLMKLGAPNRTAAVMNAIRSGLIDAP
jgi:two-component system, NarL family, nitrate/nitrite response regulator NarL